MTPEIAKIPIPKPNTIEELSVKFLNHEELESAFESFGEFLLCSMRRFRSQNPSLGLSMGLSGKMHPE